MLRYTLRFGNRSKGFRSFDEALDWADTNLSCPANLYDFDEYLCTI